MTSAGDKTYKGGLFQELIKSLGARGKGKTAKVVLIQSSARERRRLQLGKDRYQGSTGHPTVGKTESGLHSPERKFAKKGCVGRVLNRGI